MHDIIIPYQALPTYKYPSTKLMTWEMMTSRSLICLLENQNGGKLQKHIFYILTVFDFHHIVLA
jgi:hypothetical protein